MAEIKGALIVCDRCHIAAFTKPGDYDSIETPHDWNRVNFGTCLARYNLCPECYAEFEFAKRAFFSDMAKIKGGIIEWREKDGETD